MFNKLLIANRGEIAVRIMRACREMGIPTVALYDASDQGSLHVRLADECFLLDSPSDFLNGARILEIAQACAADAIHPGYGYLAEEAGFVEMCEAQGIAFIGPPSSVISAVRNKIDTLVQVWAAGFPIVDHSYKSFEQEAINALTSEAEALGFPLVVKSCRGGRGRGERLVLSGQGLLEAVRRAQDEAQAVYGDRSVYLEKAILPANQVGVQIIGDRYGNLVHLGDREGSIMVGNQKLFEETPAPSVSAELREKLWKSALEIARLYNYQNAGTVEFLVDQEGNFFFTEIKARIQMEHPLTEMVTRIDLIREQIRIASGAALSFQQADVRLDGWAIQARVSAEDPWCNNLPTPGKLHRVRLPNGPDTRVDTYVYSDCEVPAAYDPLIAKVIVWGQDRPATIVRMKRALEELKLLGTPTNLPLLQRVLEAPDFIAARYDTGFQVDTLESQEGEEVHLRDLAVAISVLYAIRSQSFQQTIPERLNTGWHRDSRRLPE